MYLFSKVADYGELCGFLRETRPPPVAKGDQRREVGGEGVGLSGGGGGQSAREKSVKYLLHFYT